MYSVIIPTLWKGRELEKILYIMDHHTLIGEVLIINNAIQNTPNWFTNRSWKKVKEIYSGNNIFVNAAWNLGVKESKFEKICLCSDDIEFNTKIFNFLEYQLDKNYGCVGPDINSIFCNFENEEFYLKERTNERINYGYGTLLFLNKNNYVPIPEELKIFFGDVWIFLTSIIQGKNPRRICNFNIKTKMETTSGIPELSLYKELDTKCWKENFNGWDKINGYINQSN
jgi:hypothetical protein